MAKIGKVQSCIFCGEAPCACNAPSKPKVKRTVALKPKPTETVDLPPPERDWTPPESSQGNRFKRVETVTAVSEEDLVMRMAIQNLAAAGMLSDRDLLQHKAIIQPPLPSDVERKLIEWRGAHGR